MILLATEVPAAVCDMEDRGPQPRFPYTQKSDVTAGEVEAAHMKSGMARGFGDYIHMRIGPRAIWRGDFGR
jgi:hypothetical protein